MFPFLVILLIFKRRRVARTHILLTGLSESGKTSLFTSFFSREFKETFTSIKENVEELALKKSRSVFQMVDLPGHERLRYKFLDQYKARARVIIFLVDSSTLQKDIRDVAE